MKAIASLVLAMLLAWGIFASVSAQTPSLPAVPPLTALADAQKDINPKPGQLPNGKFDPQQQCVQAGEFAVELKSGRHPVGDSIVLPSNFLPVGQRVEVGIRTAYTNNLRFFAARERSGTKPRILPRQDVVTRRAAPSDSVVKGEDLDAEQTIVSITLREGDAGWWQKSDLYLYTCSENYSGPARVSRVANGLVMPFRG